MEKPLVIPIIGKARNGKDTFAQYLKEKLEEKGKKVLVVRYADYLKFVLEKYYGWNGKKDEEGRTLLQHIGTDVCRKNNPDTWVNVVVELVKGLGDSIEYVLIPDARFENEIDCWYKEEFEVVSVRVVRLSEDGSEFDNGLTKEQKEHPSETSLDDYNPYYIVEARNLEELQESAEAILEEEKI